jgi:phosphohistidine phosphatase
MDGEDRGAVADLDPGLRCKDMRMHDTARRTLFLVRHAKSSWTDAGLTDRDRPLNERGERDAPRMASRLADRPKTPELIVSSPAFRARATAEYLADALPGAELRIDSRVYATDSRGLLEIVHGLEDRFRSVALVGHNPELTLFAHALSGAGVENIPTSGVVELRFSGPSWRAVEHATAELVHFDYPKRHA